MRTTVNLEDELLELAKAVSVERGCSLGEVIDDALRVTVAARPKTASRAKPRPLRTFGGGGVLPGIDLTSSSAVLDSMESR